MIAVVQRVSAARVTVDASGHDESIGPGLLVLLGVEQDDGADQAAWMARKTATLRIFMDDEGRMNRSVVDIGGSVLLISQFTLAGETSKGARPSFARAADPALAEPLYRDTGRRLEQDHQLPVRYGEFGAMMDVTLTNEGPVTIILRTPPAA